jgi:hypothetical protein
MEDPELSPRALRYLEQASHTPIYEQDIATEEDNAALIDLIAKGLLVPMPGGAGGRFCRAITPLGKLVLQAAPGTAGGMR